MKTVLQRFIVASSLVLAQSAMSHHSFANFDLSRNVTLSGSVKEFQWTNPHVWIQVLVPDTKGTPTEWSIEAGAPGMLTRTGWKSKMLMPGDKITLTIHPSRQGDAKGSLINVTLPDGRVMGPGGPPAPLPANPVQPALLGN